MNLRHKIKSQITLEQLFEKNLTHVVNESRNDLYFLVDLVHLFRPNNPKAVETVSISKLINFLKENPSQKLLL